MAKNCALSPYIEQSEAGKFDSNHYQEIISCITQQLLLYTTHKDKRSKVPSKSPS